MKTRIWMTVVLLWAGCGVPAEDAGGRPRDGGPTPADAGAGPVDGGPPDAGAVGSAGCGLLADAGVRELTLVVGGTSRRTVLVVPAGYQARHPHPLFIGLHASGGTAESGRTKMQLEASATEPAIVVYPNGTPGASPTGLRGWNLDPAGPDFALFDALLAELNATLCLDPARVVVAGFSNGAQFANALACARGDKLRMIASVSGTPAVTACVPDRVAAFLAAGENDPIVSLAVSLQVRDGFVARNGCTPGAAASAVTPCPSMTTCTCAAYGGCAVGVPVTWCQHSGGHEYPPFASPELWRVFSTLSAR